MLGAAARIFWISNALLIPLCQAQLTLYELAKTVPEDLVTFTTALDLAGLGSNSYLNSNESSLLTVLAPNNQAFESVSGKYLEPEWKNFLRALLEHHILLGDFSATSFRQNMTIPTKFTGTEVEVTESDPVTFNDNALVVDLVDDYIEEELGDLYVINNVLLPENFNSSLLEQAVANPELSRFTDLVFRMGWDVALNTSGPFTVLIPSNDAFAKIPSTILNQLEDNSLRQILLYHIIPSIHMAYQKTGTANVLTMHGSSLEFSGDGVVGEADFISRDNMANNGVYHVIDTLLLPIVAPETSRPDPANSQSPQGAMPSSSAPSAMGQITTSAPSEAVRPTAAPVTSSPSSTTSMPFIATTTSSPTESITSSPSVSTVTSPPTMTTFAPSVSDTSMSPTQTDTVSFALETASPSEMLTAPPSEVATSVSDLSSSPTQTNLSPLATDAPSKAPISVPDIMSMAPTQTETVASSVATTASEDAGTIFAVAAEVGALASFIEAVVLADLYGPLTGPGPVTVFAPVNDAFNTVPIKLYEMAWKFHLAALLEYHVIPLQEVFTVDLEEGDLLPTVEGTMIEVTSVDPWIFNGGSRLITPDVQTENGILHAINKLLLPPYVQNTVADAITLDSDLSEITRVLESSQTGAMLEMEGPFTLFAPVNTAFQKHPINAILGSLDEDGREDIVSFHVIPKLINSEDLIDGATFTTVQGGTLQITGAGSINSTELRVNDAAILATNVLANNGIIHYIDTVLIPVLTPEPTTAPSIDTEAPTSTPFGNETTAVPTFGATVSSPSPSPSSNGTDIETDSTTMPTAAVTPSGYKILLSIAEIANVNEQFSILASAINATGFFGVLDSPQSLLTVFAPTDAAFRASSINLTQYLEPQWQAHLASLLTYHLLAGTKVVSSQFMENATAPTLEGSEITVTSVNDGVITINSIPIETADLEASNGVVHVMEGVLLPPSATLSVLAMSRTVPELATFVDALVATGLDSVLEGDGPLTVFAPTSDVFSSLGEIDDETLLLLLQSHIVPGNYVELASGMELTTLAETTILLPDSLRQAAPVLVKNGVIHAIDSFLVDDLPSPTTTKVPVDATEAPSTSTPHSAGPTAEPSSFPSTAFSTDRDSSTQSPVPLPSLLDLISTDAELTALMQLLGASGVDATLKTNGTFTVFAPTDSAISDVPSFILAGLSGSPLVQTLSYHIVSGVFYSEDLFDGMVLPTLQGSNLTISVDASTGTVYVSDDSNTTAQVVSADVGGLPLHKIDSLLLPVLTPASARPSTSTPTSVPPARPTDPPTPAPTAGVGGTCDESMLAYASVCCPVENPAFQTFCEDLYNRKDSIVVDPNA